MEIVCYLIFCPILTVQCFYSYFHVERFHCPTQNSCEVVCNTIQLNFNSSHFIFIQFYLALKDNWNYFALHYSVDKGFAASWDVPSGIDVFPGTDCFSIVDSVVTTLVVVSGICVCSDFVDSVLLTIGEFFWGGATWYRFTRSMMSCMKVSFRSSVKISNYWKKIKKNHWKVVT